MAPINNTRILRAKYATDHVLTVDNFKQDTIELDTTLKAGEILVRTLYLSLDPIIRLSFNDPHSKASTLNQVITGFGLGEVIESKDPDFPRGSIVLGSNLPWESVSRINNKTGLSVIEDARNPKIPMYAYLNVLGVTGLTAWAAVDTIVKKFKKDQVVYISSAAGPVGTFFAILAKCEGAFVVGSAGSDDKVQYLLENIGLDAGFNYKTQDARAELAKAAPQGLDIYIDLVGNEMLDIALEKINDNGLVVAVGNFESAAGKAEYVFKNMMQIIFKALRVQGFAVFQHLHRYSDFWADVKPRVENGQIRVQDTIVVGLEKIAEVFVDYMNGKYTGKVIIQVNSL
ncbi:hypothetical protein BGZ93_010473 [Podila epicladia]|nr:hypothetical protein BGZ92_008702 [Podila epicladia]KAG0098760.1 hypothetical protein BGZ93_010473 [Podila epicladia]